MEYLSETERTALADVPSQYPSMYEGAIGTLNIPPEHFKLRPSTRPFHARPFPILKAFKKLTKDECRCFEQADIWEHTRDSEWAAPTFIVPKKTMDVLESSQIFES